MKTDFGLKQSRKLAENMEHWLDLFDRRLADQELALWQRPFEALLMLFREGAIAVKADGEHGDKPF